MKVRKFLLLFIFTLCFFRTYSQHTFSIVAVDAVTGEIGSAGATCLSFEDGAQDISAIVLNTGAIHTQSYWNPTNQANATARMNAGDSPDEIITWLENNDVGGAGSVPLRQYGVVDLNGGSPRSAALTGSQNFDEKGHRLGANYAIQGNILISQDVLDDMETAFLNTSGSLSDKLMASMQAAKRPGADSRCLADNISSGSAFIRIAKPTDTDSSYGNLWLDINVWLDSGTFTGDPIDELQIQYNDFINNLSTNEFNVKNISITPNPSNGKITISNLKNNIDSWAAYDLLGKKVLSGKIDNTKLSVRLDLNQVNNGIYLIQFLNENLVLSTRKLVINKD